MVSYIWKAKKKAPPCGEKEGGPVKIKTRTMSYEEVMRLPRPRHRKPRRPHWLFRTLVRLAAIPDLWSTKFSFERDMANDKDGGPYLILMNHCSFIDMEIASRILYPKPYGIVCTTDGMVGKSGLMRQIGCIPTCKFVTDMTLIRDMKYALKEKKTSVLMYPEAGYSFDGRTTTIPSYLGGLIKMLDVPVMLITTEGAFARDPLYNGLQKRKVKVSAKVTCLLNREQIKEQTAEALDAILCEAFDLDYFKWQKDNGVEIKETFRADGLERILYKCAHCGTEGQMIGKGTEITCRACGKAYHLTELGQLQATEGETEFPHIPDWYRFERACVREELEQGTYRLDTKVRIGMLVDYKALYMVGEGRLVHDNNGFHLTGCDGKLDYRHSPIASYGLNADYFWYEIGDVVCIGDRDRLFYCFPEQEGVVTKTRLATEELYKITMAARDAARQAKKAERKPQSADGTV